MCTFIEKSLSPEIFWSALGAIGTLLAVCVAVFYPMVTTRLKIIKMKNLIESEIKDNYQIVKNMVSKEDTTLPGGIKITAAQRNNELASHVKTRIWEEYRYKIASEEPEQYEKYSSINRYIEAIKSDREMPEAIRAAMLIDEANSFTKEYERRYGI